MKAKFTIGQLSRLFHIPIKTLRYYDEIGLFRPAFVDEHSHYRYYYTDQFEQLHTIQYLKILGMPLKNIQHHLENADMDAFLHLLKDHKKITERKISELEQVRDAFERRIEEIEQAKEMKPIGEIEVCQLKTLGVLQLKAKITSEAELELALNKLERQANIPAGIFIGTVGLTISKESFNGYKFNEYNSIFLLTEHHSSNTELYTTISAGTYVRLYFRGGHSDSLPYYRRIIEFLKTHQYEISGDIIERTIIDQYISDDKNKHLTEILVPVIPIF